MAKLRTYVHVDGEVYGPDDDLPADVAAKITNPKVWAGESDEDTDAQAERQKPGTPTGARLAGYVQVDGRMYGPADEVPVDVAAQITNPKAWEGGKLPDLAPAGDASSEAGAAPAGSASGQTEAQTVDTPAPSRSGRGSGAEAWAAWASARGVTVAAGSSREDIIAACEQAGVLEAAGQ